MISPQDKDSSDKTSNPSAEHQELDNSCLSEMSLEEIITRGTDCQFQSVIYQISEEIQFGDNSQLLSCKMLHLRLLKLFYKLYKDLDTKKDSHEYLLFVISLLAEILRKNT